MNAGKVTLAIFSANSNIDSDITSKRYQESACALISVGGFYTAIKGRHKIQIQKHFVAEERLNLNANLPKMGNCVVRQDIAKKIEC